MNPPTQLRSVLVLILMAAMALSLSFAVVPGAGPLFAQEDNPTLPFSPLPPGQSPEGFALRPVTQELSFPLEILYGPDGFLWVTERTGRRVTRIDPESGESHIALRIGDVHQSAAQDGVLGMVFHPEFLQDTGNDYVYLSYTYLPGDDVGDDDADDVDDTGDDTDDSGDDTADDTADVGDDDAGDANGDDTDDAQTTDDVGDNDADDADDDDDPDRQPGLTDRRTRIVRYTYDAGRERLGEPVVLLEDLPASNDHNSGRFVFSPDDTLFYALGDQGNNQFDRACLPILAQVLPTAEEVEAEDWTHYVGKILRMNLDGSIPEDNPVIDGVQSHVYSYGHRNVQGLALSPDGKLYATEHGPKTDDEVNLIEAGKNYGWPHVAGYQDDQAYVYGNWSAAEDCEDLEFSDFEIPDSVPVELESEWSHPDFVPPIYTFGTVPDDYDFQPEVCAPLFYQCWPTIAPTGVEIYVEPDAAALDWPTSLLVTSLKTGSVYRLELNEDGTAIVGDAVPMVNTTNRYRDVFIDAEAGVFYVITDTSGYTQGSFTIPTGALEFPGAILEFSYVGEE